MNNNHNIYHYSPIGCIGSFSAGEGKGSTFHVELPLFTALSAPEQSDLSYRSQMKKSYRKENYPIDTVIMHPRGSGLNASVSISDIVSLDRKIRGRVMSSDQLSLLDVASSRGSSRRGSKVSIDINLRGMVEREKSCSSIILPMRQDSNGWSGISTIFSRESIRVGVSDSDADPGVIGPYLRPREAVEVVKVKVLVVDDSSPTRKLLSKILVGKGFQVHCAIDGQSCLDMIESAAAQGSSVNYTNVYDVIIMDSNMPRMSGNETCKILRDKGFKGMICGVTGDTSQKDVDSFLASGASLVLPKPLDMNAFETELRAFLRTEVQDYQL